MPRGGSLEELLAFANKIRAVICVSGSEFEKPIAVSASIGIARSPDHGISSGQLLHAADQAMYRAKQEGALGIAIGHAAAMTITTKLDEARRYG